MPELQPLEFEPILREYIWGGRRLESVLGKTLGGGDRYAESWEVVDHGEDQSVVAGGPFTGKALHQLVTEHGQALFGRHAPREQFPLLFKFLDAHRKLSVQVHPNDAQAAQLDPPDLGKTEAWVVLAAEPGSTIYAGLKPGVDRAMLEKHLAEGTCDQCLHQFQPRVGDCIFLEAGTVHAIGAGLVIAEIQQASDTTYRLFDWNRVDKDGQPRPLHIEQSLDVIAYDRGPVEPREPQPTGLMEVQQLVECDKFILDRWHIDSAESYLETDDRFHILACVEGSAILATGDYQGPIAKGRTVLVPACCQRVQIVTQGDTKLLDMYLP